MTTRALCAVLAYILIAFSAVRADGSPLSRARTRAGYALAYELQFADCYNTLAEAITADPLDPAPRRAIAAVTWIEMLFTQGVATFEAFTGEISKGDVIRPTTPPLLVERFHRMIEEARRLAEQRLTHADDADTVRTLARLSGWRTRGCEPPQVPSIKAQLLQQLRPCDLVDTI
jgi:hypothetical protein